MIESDSPLSCTHLRCVEARSASSKHSCFSIATSERRCGTLPRGFARENPSRSRSTGATISLLPSLVDKIRYPGTKITPAAFEAEMQQLQDAGITVISMQDLLAWKRGEKSIPPRCAVITFDDGWKSQYEVGWPIMKKFGYPFTMFIYTAYRGRGRGKQHGEQMEVADNGVESRRTPRRIRLARS